LFPPYIMGDKGYPLISWIMIPFKEERHLFVLELLHNKKHKRGHLVMENVFNIPKKTFRELLAKFYFSVSILPNVFNFCHLLHNLLIFHCFKNPIWTPYYIKLKIVLEHLQTYNLSFFECVDKFIFVMPIHNSNFEKKNNSFFLASMFLQNVQLSWHLMFSIDN
jgi:hypothetical protein